MYRNIFIPESIHTIYDYFFGWKFLYPFGYPLHKRELIKPFFIVGSGGSGNTLLRRFLCSHSKIYIPPETYVLGQLIKTFRKTSRLKWKYLVYQVLSELEYYPEFETFQVSLRPLAKQLVNTPEKYRSLAFILDSFYKYHAHSLNFLCLRWGDKTPLNTFYLERIYKVFPKAQFIHLIRDGCDVISSYVEAHLYNNIEAAAKRWCASIDLASNFVKKYPKSCLEIKYENLVTNPKLTVQKICNFLEIEYEDTMLNSELKCGLMGDVDMRQHHKQVYKPISTSSIGKGRYQLTDQEKQRLQKLIGNHLEKLGYQPCTS